jgi:hypothetical protein
MKTFESDSKALMEGFERLVEGICDGNIIERPLQRAEELAEGSFYFRKGVVHRLLEIDEGNVIFLDEQGFAKSVTKASFKRGSPNDHPIMIAASVKQ